MKRLIAAAVLALSSVGAPAQQFPAKPIHLVVTFAAGGATDLTARSGRASCTTSTTMRTKCATFLKRPVRKPS
jgi:tripartite-type tricarboxylate transporter receptor subunit TctC